MKSNAELVYHLRSWADMFKWLYNRITPNTPTQTHSTATTQHEAEAAIIRAEKEYQMALQNGERVDRVVRRLRDQREPDNFAMLIEKTMRGVG
jgi:hypothetical protein